MMQHQEQESRETLPRPRLTDEPLVAIGNTIRTMQAHGAPLADIVAYALASVDAQAQEHRQWLKAGMTRLADAINADGPLPITIPVRRLKTATNTLAMKLLTTCKRGATIDVDKVDALVQKFVTTLEQPEGDNPSHERTVQALPR